MALTQTQVSQLYVSLFGRASEGEGNTFWKAEANLETAANAMLATSASSTYFGGDISDQQFIETIYLNTLGKTYAQDTSGVDFWVAALAAGNTRGLVVSQLIASAIDPATAGAAQDMFNNQVAVSNYCADNIATADAADLSAFVGYISSVTSDAATVTAAQTSIATDAGAVTFALTAATDTVIGSAHNDIITGTSATIQAGDTIIDQSTTDSDTLNVTLTANNAAFRVAGIEAINVNWDSIANAAFTATSVTGATITVGSERFGFTGNATITDAGANTIVAGTGLTGTLTVNGITTGNIDAGSAVAVSVAGAGTVGAVDKTTVTANAATFGVTNAASVDELTLQSTVASTITLDAISDKVTIAGDKSIVLKSGALTTEKVYNTLTDGATLTVQDTNAGATDMTNVQADTIKITAGTGGAASKTVAVGANVYLNVDLGNAASTITEAAATATTNTLTLNVDKDQTGLVLTNIKTSTITASAAQATGAASAIDLTFAVLDAGTNNVVLKGADDVKVTAGTAASVDATDMTGLLNYTQATAVATSIVGAAGANNITVIDDTHTVTYVGQNAGDTFLDTGLTTGTLSVTTGSGNDTITQNTSNIAAGAIIAIQSGAGNDTITLTTNDVAQSSVQAGDGNDTVSMVALTSGTTSVDLGTGNDTFTFGATTVTGVVALVGGEGTDTIKVVNGTDLSGSTLSLSGIEYIQLMSAAGTATFDASDLTGTSISLQGTGAVTSSLFTDMITVTTATAGSYNFSGITVDNTLTYGIGGLAITGNAGNDTIVGSQGNDTIASNGGTDTITGGLGHDVMTAGAGVDTFVIASGDAGTTVTTIDTIIAFLTAGADKLSLGVAGSTTNYAEVDMNTAAASDYADALAAANTALDGTVRYAVIENSADTGTGWDGKADAMLFVDFNMDGTADAGIQLTGLLGAGLAYTDIIA